MEVRLVETNEVFKKLQECLDWVQEKQVRQNICDKEEHFCEILNLSTLKLFSKTVTFRSCAIISRTL
jgi:hypothetical protein